MNTQKAILLPKDWNEHPDRQLKSTYDEVAWREIIKEATGAGAEVIELTEETVQDHDVVRDYTKTRWVSRWEED